MGAVIVIRRKTLLVHLIEIFGIILAIPAAFIASTIYAVSMRWLTSKIPWLANPVLIVSIAVLAGLAIEWCLLLVIGTMRIREIIGSAFYALHLTVFFLSIPGLANIIILRRATGGFWRLLMVGACCAALTLPIALTQVAVSAVLYGVDGSGGPDGTE